MRAIDELIQEHHGLRTVGRQRESARGPMNNSMPFSSRCRRCIRIDPACRTSK
jgi:hypothetical protein